MGVGISNLQPHVSGQRGDWKTDLRQVWARQRGRAQNLTPRASLRRPLSERGLPRATWTPESTRTDRKGSGGDSPTPVSPSSGTTLPGASSPQSSHPVSPPGPPPLRFGVPTPLSQGPSFGRALLLFFPPHVCPTSFSPCHPPPGPTPGRQPPASPHPNEPHPGQSQVLALMGSTLWPLSGAEAPELGPANLL